MMNCKPLVYESALSGETCSLRHVDDLFFGVHLELCRLQMMNCKPPVCKSDFFSAKTCTEMQFAAFFSGGGHLELCRLQMMNCKPAQLSSGEFRLNIVFGAKHGHGTGITVLPPSLPQNPAPGISMLLLKEGL